jgi:type VI protein secretion system component VasK
MPRARGKVTIEVSRELRDRIKELSQKYGVLYESLLSEALNLYTQSKEGLLTQSKATPVSQVDCVARRAKKGDKPLNVYLVECKDGAKAIVPREALADLSERFKLRIEVVD